MKRICLIFAIGLFWPALAAAEVDYSYAQVGYGVGDIDTGGNAGSAEESYSGYNLEASAGFAGMLFVQGAYSNMSLEGDLGDLIMSSAGVGAHMPVNFGEATDVYGKLSYESFNTDLADGSGYGATLGARWQPSDTTEVEPSIAYLDYGEVENDAGTDVGDMSGWRLGVRGTFDVSERFAVSAAWRSYRLTLDTSMGDADVDLSHELRFGMRYYWMM